jgi:putative ABC transport system ATP-binding protein
MSGNGEPASLWQEPVRPAEDVRWPALHLRDVFKIYRSGPVETVALRGVELRVEEGELLAVRGPSGCGKSTMLALAAGMDTPSAGEVRVGEQSLQQMDELELAQFRARGVALVFQSENMWPLLSARENVTLGLRLAGTAEPRAVAEEALARFGLRDRADGVAAALSGGEQQRAAIAAAFARRAPLVLADEPTGELDAANERVVLDALEQLCVEHGTTVVVVTHSEAVASAAHRVVEVMDGRVVS